MGANTIWGYKYPFVDTMYTWNIKAASLGLYLIRYAGVHVTETPISYLLRSAEVILYIATFCISFGGIISYIKKPSILQDILALWDSSDS